MVAYNLKALPRERILDLIQKHGFRQRVANIDLRARISGKIHRDIIAFEEAFEKAFQAKIDYRNVQNTKNKKANVKRKCKT